MTPRSSALLALALGCVLAPPPAAARAAAPPARGVRPPPLHAAPARVDTLAVVDGDAITADDLVLRAGLMPWPRRHAAVDADSARVRALRALVAERLLASDVARGGITIDTVRVAHAARSLRGALARDALWHAVARGAPPAAAEIDRVLAAGPPPRTVAARRARRRAIADSLATVAGSARAREFLGGLLGGTRAVVDSVELLVLADTLRTLAAAARAAEPSAPEVAAGEFADALVTRLGPRLGHTLVALPGAPLTVGEAIDALRFYPVAIHARTPRGFAAELSAKLRTIVESEVAAREALRRGYGTNPDVARELDTWVTAWRAQLALVELARHPRDMPPAQAADRYIATLATRARIEVRPQALARVRLPEPDIVTRRILGFGGSILAAPPLPSLWNWPQAAPTPLPLP